MTSEALKQKWLKEESAAQIHGWDFSHIHGRYEEEQDLPWDYETVVRQYLTPDTELLDFDTGGGEFLLSLNHPHHKITATEGYPPNVTLCRERLEPLGIRFRECADASRIPFDMDSFDLFINRHGDFDVGEAYRLLRNGGMFIIEQVGGDNDRDLVEMVLPGLTPPHPELNLETQRKRFEDADFQIIQAEEAYRPILFYDVGAFIWFARIIEWEFPGFSVEKCYDRLLEMQRIIECDGVIKGTIHRYLIVDRKS